MASRFKRVFNQWRFAFPIQLLVSHLRGNSLLIVVWVFLVLLINGDIVTKLGGRYLFLDPEYQGHTGFWSFFFIGMGLGCFFLTWNLSTYLLSARYFPFLACLVKPFQKFVLNNLLVPGFFMVFYLISIVRFQGGFLELSPLSVVLQITGLLTGFSGFLLFYFSYFYYTNRDISYYQRRGTAKPWTAPPIADDDTWFYRRRRPRVDAFLIAFHRYRLVRSVEHYDPRVLMSIFRQNHINALLIILLIMVILSLLGFATDWPLLRVPAGASMFFLLSVIIAVIGAITHWFRAWRWPIILLMLLVINAISQYDIIRKRNQAYGLNYGAAPAVYSYPALQAMCTPEQVAADQQATEAILERWKQRTQRGATKPKMVVLSVSGGGLRSATWAMHVVQQMDSLSGGKLLDHTVLITGASGGILGMSYLRELYLQQQQGVPVNLYAPKHLEAISKDILNSVAFSLTTSDLFFPVTFFWENGNRFPKDRAYAFERQFDENTTGVLNHSLAHYRAAEQQALIPMLYLSPAIVNDTRRLIISPQGVSFMMVPPIGVQHPEVVEIDAVDFGRLFQSQEADSLRFLSALRMNATFPYILPSVHLPSRPGIEVMDAGFRDNYGLLSATRFIQVFRNWILENTSGVVILQITSSEKIEPIPHSERKGIISSLLNPLEIASRILDLQEFEQDNDIGFIYDLMGEDRVKLVRFSYQPGRNHKIMASISFHITSKEKQVVLEALDEPENQRSKRELLRLLGEE